MRGSLRAGSAIPRHRTAAAATRSSRVGGDPTGAETSLLSLSPTHRQTRWAIAVGVCQVAALALLGPFAKTQLPEINAFIPAFGGVILVTSLVTSVLLFSQFAIYRLRALVVLACGYLFSALIIIPYTLTFPGAFSPTGLLGAGLQTTASLYWFWHLLFPIALLGYGLMRDEKSDQGQAEPSSVAVIVGSVALVFTLACGLTLFATAGNNYLPVLFTDRVAFTPAARAAGASTMLLSASAITVLWLRRRSLLDQWLMIVALAAILEMALGAIFVSGRFSLGFYAGRLFSLLTSTIVLVVLLAETARLYTTVARSQEGKIRRLVDANIIGIFMWDFDGRVLEANEAFLRIVGYEHEDLVAGRIRWTDLTPPEWHERDSRLIQEHRATGILQPFEKEYFRKDGSRVPVLIGVATFEEGGNQGVAFVLDLTERKRAEQALRNSEAKFRDFAETASDWFCEMGPDYKFTLLSENAFGSGAADRIGTAWWEHALDLETEPEKWRLIRETLDAHRPFRDFVYRSLRGDGTPMYVKASGKPMFDANAEFRGYRGTASDVTAIMRAQEEHERLRQLESDLAHMNRLDMMGQQAASLSHEITQPIAAARNYARAALNFLSQQPPDLGEVKKQLGSVVGAADRSGEIIERIRDHIKKAPPRKTHFDLNQAIDEVIVLARSAITRNGVSVQTLLSEGSAPVQGDRVQLQQVVLNLILNAVEAMGSVAVGTRELLISTEQNQSNEALVAVRDSGPGLDPENLERVFEAFYTTKSSGMGMGLSICRSIIDAHGGRLWANVNEPRGAVFQFTLPHAEREIMDPHPAARHTRGRYEDCASDALHTGLRR